MLIYNMKILGIDPGSTRTGYGLIEKHGHDLKLIKSGLLKIISRDKNVRLLELSKSFADLLKKQRPDFIAIEKIFFMKNMKTAVEVAQSRGVLLLVATSLNIPIIELSPSEVKLNIAGHGGVNKKLVADMVFKILKIKKTNILDDITDAIAIAIVAAHQTHWLSIMNSKVENRIRAIRSKTLKGNRPSKIDKKNK